MSDSAWGGRFREALSKLALLFSASVDVDKRLAPEDITGSIAHARMLGKQGIITADESAKIIEGLKALQVRVDSNALTWNAEHEDVHMNLERALSDAIGAVGGKLHTARSRNDQVATDMRLWTRSACAQTVQRIDALQAVLCVRAQSLIDVLMPGYTHLQRAQPVRLSHHLHAWCMMLERDRSRLVDASKRLNESPLGSAALAGTTFAIDRDATAKELGFDRPTRNSIDAVADRDFLLEVCAALAITAVHLSRFAEELVLWTSQEFRFVELSDAVTTGSSIMPQKKNPDMAELIRGKSGRVIGDLVSLLVMLKGLPLAYNRDMQEDKEPAFDAFDTVNASLDLMAAMLATARFDEKQMAAALEQGFVDATEIADWLAAKGVPFREAHHAAGQLVQKALQSGRVLRELKLDEYQSVNKTFDADIFKALDMQNAVERRNVVGGPAKARVQGALRELSAALQARGVDIAQTAKELGAK